MGLLERINSGDRVAWNELVKRFQRRVFITALAVIKNMDDADEITQEVFVRLFSNIKKINDEKAIGPWLVKTAYNLASDNMRYQKIRGWFSIGRKNDYEIGSRDVTADEAVYNHQFVNITNAWLNSHLSKKERVTLQLKIGEEMTFEEIAEALKMSPSAVKTHYYRAVKKMDGLSHKIKREV